MLHESGAPCDISAMTRLLARAALLALGGLTALAAASGPVGIAYVEAPERAAATCVAANPDRAFACAREKCVAEGVAGRDCLRVAWCFPAGWSVDVFMQNRDGFHWHEFTCGLGSREHAERLAALQCDRALAPELLECTAVRFFDPEGRELPPNPAD